MKLRSGFVSNSSSSSFICSVCGETQSGMDLCLSDADMFRCENGHDICNEHKLRENEELARTRLGDDFDVDEYETPYELCPICTFKNFTTDDMFAYAVKIGLVDVPLLEQQIKEGFTSYKEFSEHICLTE